MVRPSFSARRTRCATQCTCIFCTTRDRCPLSFIALRVEVLLPDLSAALATVPTI